MSKEETPQPTAQDIEQWKKEAEAEYPHDEKDGYLYNDFQDSSREGFVAGRQKSFEEYWKRIQGGPCSIFSRRSIHVAPIRIFTLKDETMEKTDNELIADFMAEPIAGTVSHSRRIYPEYEDDWAELMPVVEKIERFADVTINLDNCYIQREIAHPQMETISDIDGPSKIEATYKACVEFIKWYNSQKVGG